MHRTVLNALALCSIMFIVGCATPVALPPASRLPEVKGQAKFQPLMPLRSERVAARALPTGTKARLPALGERIVNGIVLSPMLADVLRMQSEGRLDEAIALLEAAEVKAADPLSGWYQSALRTHLLNLSGRASEAETLAATVAQREIALRGGDMVARALRGESRARLGDFDAALADFHTVLNALGNWRFPTSYGGPPSNLTDLALTTEARMRALLGLSFAHTMAGRHSDALAWGEEAEQHMADVFQVAAHPLYGPVMGRLIDEAYIARASNLAFLAASHLALGASDATAEPYFDAALSYYDAVGFSHGPATIAGLRAMALLRAGRIADAERAAKDAVDLARTAGLTDLIWRIRAIEGEALLAAGRRTDAETAFREAQKAVDRLTGLAGSDRDKRRLGIGKEDITYRLTRLGFQRGDTATLFRDLERGRARAFVDMLATVPVAGAVQEMADLKAIDHQLTSLTQARESGRTTRTIVVEDTMDSLLTQRQVKLDRIRRINPDLADTRGIPEADLSAARSALRTGELLVYFLPARNEDALQALLISAERAWTETYPLTAAALALELKKLAKAIAEEDPAGQQASADRLSTGLRVSSWQGRHLVRIVPSGHLYSVPWGITATPAPVVVMPTGSWHARQPSGQASGKAVVVGDPDFGGRLTQLPGARTEANRIAKMLGVEPIIGSQASADAIRAALGSGSSLLHLATHGKFNSRNPLRSAVYLKGGEPLTAAQLFEAPLPAQIVVLSACETGIGEAVAGDDFLGLPRSFYLGGSRSVLSSLWPVDDDGTLAFMEEFHRQANRGNLANAWLAARDRLRREGQPPWVFGAFILGGSP